MQNIKFNHISIDYPSCWNELNKDQFFQIIALFKLNFSDLEFRIRTIFILLNLVVAKSAHSYRSPDVLHLVKYKKENPFYLSNEQILAMANTVNFLIHQYSDEKGNEFLSLNSNLTINLMPRFRHKFKMYYGPGNNLFNICFDEYMEADTHFLNYIKSNNVLHLNKLIATLFRPARNNYNPHSAQSTGDIRQPFNSNVIDHHASVFSSLNMDVKIAISLFYNGCRQFISYNFKNVFNTSPGESKGSSNQFGSMSLVDALTNDDVTKNDLVRKSLLYDVMVRLERAAILNKEAHENANKLKNK